MEKIILSMVVIFFIMASGVIGATSMNFLTKGFADSLYCHIDGSNCAFNGSLGGGKIAQPPYLYNDSTNLYFNETKLNATIDNRANISITLYNQSLNTSDNVQFNKLNLTDDMIAHNIFPLTTLLYDLGSGAKRWRFLYVQNISSDYIDNAYDVNVAGNVTADYFIGSGAYLTDLNISGDLTGYALNVSFLFGHGGIGGMDLRGDPWYLSGTDLEIAESLDVDNDVNIDGELTVDGDICNSTDCYSIADFLLDTDTDTHVKGDDIYLYNDSTTMYLNETKLNNTIGLIVNDSTISISENYSFYNLNVTGTFIRNISQSVEVCKSGCEFDTIQSAIDSITDAAGDKFYEVIVHSGIYSECITGKNFVYLSGYSGFMGMPIIRCDSGTVYNAPGLISGIANVALYAMDTTDYVTFFNITGGSFGLDSSRVYFSSSEPDINFRFADIDTGAFISINTMFQADLTGDGDNQIQQTLFNVTNSGTLDLVIAELQYESTDHNDIVKIISEDTESTYKGRNTANNFIVKMLNEDYEGSVVYYCSHNQDTKRTHNGNSVFLESSGAGNGYIYCLNTSDTSINGSLFSSHNSLRVEGFDGNYYALIEENDTLNAKFDDVIAINGTIGDGTVNYIYSTQEGVLVMSERIGIGTDKPNYAVHLKENSTNAVFMQMTNDITGHGSVSGFYFGVNTDGEGALYTGFGGQPIVLNPYLSLNGDTRFQGNGLINSSMVKGLLINKVNATALIDTPVLYADRLININITSDNITTEKLEVNSRGYIWDLNSTNATVFNIKNKKINTQVITATNRSYFSKFTFTNIGTVTAGISNSILNIQKTFTTDAINVINLIPTFSGVGGIALAGYSVANGTYTVTKNVKGLDYGGSFTTTPSFIKGYKLNVFGINAFGIGGFGAKMNISTAKALELNSHYGFINVLRAKELYGLNILAPSSVGTGYANVTYQARIAETNIGRENYQVWLDGNSENSGIWFNDNNTKIGSTKPNEIKIGDGSEQVNITLTSQDGTEWNCGVSNAGVFSCS